MQCGAAHLQGGQGLEELEQAAERRAACGQAGPPLGSEQGQERPEGGVGALGRQTAPVAERLLQYRRRLGLPLGPALDPVEQGHQRGNQVSALGPCTRLADRDLTRGRS